MHKTLDLLEFWKSVLNITIKITCERISIHQVTAENSRCATSLVGVVNNGRSATIYHTRSLKEDDIIHELLHIAFPECTEADVSRLTTDLLSFKNNRRLINKYLRNQKLAGTRRLA